MRIEKLGRGVVLNIKDGPEREGCEYIKVGTDGGEVNDVMLRGCGKVFCFNSWADLIAAIDPAKATDFWTDDKIKYLD